MLPVAQPNKASEVSKAKSKQARTGRARERAKERLDEALVGLEQAFPDSDPAAVIEPARQRPDLRLDDPQCETLSPSHGRHTTPSRFTRLLTGWSKTSIGALRVHLEPRWAAACGAWFGALLAVLLGLTDWRVAVMAAATAFMIARAGDVPDDY
jgi:hypothetical protein